MSLTASHLGATWHRQVRPNPRAWSRGGLLAWPLFALPVGLYALTVALLLWRLGQHPPYAYNWEQYTARDVMAFWAQPSFNIFRPNDGLMTDSGKGNEESVPALGTSLITRHSALERSDPCLVLLLR